MIKQKLQQHFRRQRMEAFAVCFDVNDGTRVLDVGGTPENWLLLSRERRPRVTLLNLPAHPWFEVPEGMTYQQGSGLALPYDRDAFDVIYSNSVIEHVETWENQVSFAKEIRRVGMSYYVQTPNRWFPVEPHLLAEPRIVPRPLVHFLPRRWQRAPLVPAWYREIRLLTLRELRALFPDARIDRERVIGLTKSFVIWRIPGGAAASPS